VEILKDQIIAMKNFRLVDTENHSVQELLHCLPKSIETLHDFINIKQKIETFALSNENAVNYDDLSKTLQCMIAENQSCQIATTSDDSLPKNQRDQFNQILNNIKSTLIDSQENRAVKTAGVYDSEQVETKIGDKIASPLFLFKSFLKSNIGRNLVQNDKYFNLYANNLCPQSNSTPKPPNFAHIASDLQDGHYVIVWDPPLILSGVFGYKVYINDNIMKVISDPSCTTTIIQCPNDVDLRSISMVSVGCNNLESESIRVQIDANFNRDRLSVIRLQINNDEECSEV